VIPKADYLSSPPGEESVVRNLSKYYEISDCKSIGFYIQPDAMGRRRISFGRSYRLSRG